MPSKPRSLAGIVRHRAAADAEYNRSRRDPVAARIYRSPRWVAVRAQVLRDEPVCRVCAAAGRTELATQVDHVVGVAVRPDLAFDRTNLQPLCTVCHAAKSTAERRPEGVGGTSISHASRPESGTRGTSQFSRVSHFGPNRPSRHGRPASGGCLSER
jgi:5-methylcytosine-specific restriction protein A